MCGRFTLTTPSDELASAFPGFVLPEDPHPRYNIAPGQDVLVVPNLENRRAAMYRWGLVPAWAKDPAVGHRLINARAETLAEKPSFRIPFRKRRCLILSDGFFEWKKAGKSRMPYYVRAREGRPFAMAGLWDIWHPLSGDALRSCTIITTDANPLVRKVHDRMPAILNPADYLLWLAPETEKASSNELQTLLTPFPATEMEAYPVSSLVNSPRNDLPQCIEPVPEAGLSTNSSLF